MPLHITFLIDGIYDSIHVAQKFWLLRQLHFCFGGFWINIILTQISSCIKAFDLEKYGATILNTKINVHGWLL